MWIVFSRSLRDIKSDKDTSSLTLNGWRNIIKLYFHHHTCHRYLSTPFMYIYICIPYKYLSLCKQSNETYFNIWMLSLIIMGKIHWELLKPKRERFTMIMLFNFGISIEVSYQSHWINIYQLLSISNNHFKMIHI